MADKSAKPTTNKNISLRIQRLFTRPDSDVYDSLEWQTGEARITSHQTGETVFLQEGVEFPKGWSQNAINIVAQKYFAGELGASSRERSLKQLINRVVDTITNHGSVNDYFASKTEAETFRAELKHVLASQRAAFNSPVWFNIGAEARAQQASACFILAVEDNMESILNWYYEEGMIFKGGSGAGINLSSLRSRHEVLGNSSGKASGPVSFMRGADSSAGAIRSGGKTRRAAKMVILNADHPDVEDFIWCKANEEKKGRALAEAGFDMGLDGDDIASIQYQNANNSVRASDRFMEAAINDESWDLPAVNSDRVVKTVPAKKVMRDIARAAWECADPGMQFDDIINHWHTTPNAGRINASNPCSEYMHIDNSACNLASINLLKFLDGDGRFDTDAFLKVVELMILAQEILVGYSEYPTEKITKNAKAYRQLGLGYANLGALLMSQGLAYDSDGGRAWAAAITSLMTGRAYATSARVAAQIGPFKGFSDDRDGVLRVLKLHRQAAEKIDTSCLPEELHGCVSVWDEAVELAEVHGVRNSQATVLAPTGTIALMMDCDTTGIEPELGLIKYKTLVGGGSMQFVNNSTGRALSRLGYSDEQRDEIVAYIERETTTLGAPHLKDEHQSVFACSMGDNPIHHLGHIKMMGAAQPFLSGAISKTVNMPQEATIDQVEELFIEAWRLGVKAVAIYRDNCKVDQPLQVGRQESDATTEATNLPAGLILREAVRHPMPPQRNSKTFKFVVAGTKGFMTVGEFDDGTPGEIFVQIAKQGSTMAGIIDSLAISISYGLQYGVPLKSYVKAFMNMSFAPSGVTDDPEIRTTSSLIDYMFRKLARVYLTQEDQLELGVMTYEQIQREQAKAQPKLLEVEDDRDKEIIAASPPSDDRPSTRIHAGPLCVFCGNATQQSGSCYICTTCGQTTGCG